MSKRTTVVHRIWRILEAWRLGRMLMLAVITGSTAYGFGAALPQALRAAAIAALLALGGFYLDYLADWRKDRDSGKLLNPLATGELSIPAAWVFVAIGVGGSLALALLASPLMALPVLGVVVIVGGLGIGWLDTPVLRAFSLGAIQALYVLIGGLAAGRASLGVWLTALYLFFAMTGGKIMGDVRDLPHDTRAGTLTIPQKYGLRWASAFLLINELLAYGAALSVYLVGALGSGYLYCILATILSGVVINAIFIRNPIPKIADITNKLSFIGLGSLYVLGMILGRL